MLLSLKDDHKQHISLLISQPTNEKLDVQPEIIRNAVEGLVNLLVESCRHQLSDIDFHDTVLTLGFSEEHQETLESFYRGKKQEIYDVLSQLTLDQPHYHDLEWRFEVQVASRALQHQVTPLITMNLALETKTGLASDSTTTKNIVLQTDPTNLVHITQVLEEALQESRSQHSRRIQRSFK
ncbi:COMM domain-containing protein 2 isoform X2 [Cryptotermes secundus]|uniref:COMM domain-containing protein 2 isoform X2 n=1 Tax=Cryptotermes secundus TaxID=105785 RepID=UPI000CD7B408|nr:COMM domain-containing protein 2 isoform X2 [Cryptotermes secundus]